MTPLSDQSDTEWVCDWCGLYGTEAEARHHAATTQPSHEIRELDAELTAAVRAERRRLAIERSAAFVKFARAMRRVGGALE